MCIERNELDSRIEVRAPMRPNKTRLTKSIWRRRSAWSAMGPRSSKSSERNTTVANVSRERAIRRRDLKGLMARIVRGSRQKYARLTAI